ncbi:O-antigen polymerase [Micromonospora sp. NPDC049523]|uniref:O-antigen polymerase n=1 Tax=Micromonospora sp. NPDC049523 TaxID=3155921 RepID=UPI00341895D9
MVVPIYLFDAGAGVVAAFVAGAIIAVRTSIWLAVCTAAWALVFTFVLRIPGPYDSPSGPAAIPVLGVFVACFLVAWYVGRRLADRRRAQPLAAPAEAATWPGTTAHGSAAPEAEPAERAPAVAPRRRMFAGLPRPELSWPTDRQLAAFLLVLFVMALIGAALKFRGELPPVFAENPDAAREIVRLRSNIFVGVFSEAWTLGMAISLLRALSGPRHNRVAFFLLVVVFTFGAALGASKNSVLVGIVPALVAALSTRRPSAIRKPPLKASLVVLLIGLVALGAAVYLGGQRTLAGTGKFEDQFRSQYGGSAISTSVGSLDLSLSSSTETFGRLWEDRNRHEPAWGRYSLTFTGSIGDRLWGHADLYAITAQQSRPFYMNTATFVAIPLMDYGPIGAAVFLALTGLLVGVVDRRLEGSVNPALQIARAIVIYYATFGVYEYYPLLQPIWLTIVPVLVALYLVSSRTRLRMPAWKR